MFDGTCLKKRGYRLIETIISTVDFTIRIILALLSILIVCAGFSSMGRNIRGDNPLIFLFNKVTKESIPIMYWENSIGRSRNSDVVLEDPSVSRDHAVLLRREEGWMITDTNSKLGVYLNKNKVTGREPVYLNDTITLGSTELVVKKCFANSKKKDHPRNRRNISQGGLLFLVTVFSILESIELFICDSSFNFEVFVPFGLLIAVSWTFYFLSKYIFKRINFEIETLALFLCSIGIGIIASDNIKKTYVQIIAMILGTGMFCFIIWFIKDPDRVMKYRLKISGVAIFLFAINLFFGTVHNGSQNWIEIGPLSIQPSELIKIAFIFVGASTLDKLQTGKNLTEFICFSAICIGALFLMGDFGTACIFFVTFLIISFMRSGEVRTIILICVAAVLGAFMILKFKPYVANRFAAWGHVWDYADTLGYQQTRVLTYSASGGLFGVGLANGELKHVFAAASDLAFGMICEELGIIIAIVAAFIIGGFAMYTRKACSKSRSTFYYISACSAAGLLVFQACLNIFGATDILPLTGVTLPFISMGGSSMISVWGLLAFIKVSDERTYATRRK